MHLGCMSLMTSTFAWIFNPRGNQCRTSAHRHKQAARQVRLTVKEIPVKCIENQEVPYDANRANNKNTCSYSVKNVVRDLHLGHSVWLGGHAQILYGRQKKRRTEHIQNTYSRGHLLSTSNW